MIIMIKIPSIDDLRSNIVTEDHTNDPKWRLSDKYLVEYFFEQNSQSYFDHILTMFWNCFEQISESSNANNSTGAHRGGYDDEHPLNFGKHSIYAFRK